MSLQFHEEKMEHHFVLCRGVRLHYKDVNSDKFFSQVYMPGSVIEIMPKSVHRMEARTNLLLIEVSTNHLDDIVRLEDEYQRETKSIQGDW